MARGGRIGGDRRPAVCYTQSAMGRTVTFRNRLALITTSITVLALVVAGALVALTTSLHRASGVLADAVESVRLTEEAEIDLLLHASSHEPMVREKLRTEILRRLNEARQYVTTDEEARVLAGAETRVQEYFAAPSPEGASPGLREAAYAMLEALVRINVDQARDARGDARRWNAMANVIGLGTSLVLLLLTGSLLWWLRSHAFRPVFALSEAMDRFGRGDRSARAVEEGPEELRDMAARFNQMAGMLDAQREAQVSALAGIAHDLRNPLSAVAVSMAVMDAGRPLPEEPEIRRLVERANRQVARLDRMINDLLDLSKIHAGHLELRMREVDLRRPVRESVETFLPLHPTLTLALPETPVWVRCDALRVEQVVTNLVSNAIKYSTDREAVEIELTQEGSEAVIAVTDRGIGISAEDQRRLFEPFRRVGLSRETIPGAGLGLFVVRRIVEGHGGRIEVDSAPGRGSRFRVRLATLRVAESAPARVEQPATL